MLRRAVLPLVLLAAAWAGCAEAPPEEGLPSPPADPTPGVSPASPTPAVATPTPDPSPTPALSPAPQPTPEATPPPPSPTPSPTPPAPSPTPPPPASPTPPPPASPTPPPPAPEPTGFTLTASVSDPTPCQYATVTVTVRAVDDAGAPVTGASVTSTWHYRTTTSEEGGTTNTEGYAHLSRGISRATAGYTVHVEVSATKEGQRASASTSFTPRDC